MRCCTPEGTVPMRQRLKWMEFRCCDEPAQVRAVHEYRHLGIGGAARKGLRRGEHLRRCFVFLWHAQGSCDDCEMVFSTLMYAAGLWFGLPLAWKDLMDEAVASPLRATDFGRETGVSPS